MYTLYRHTIYHIKKAYDYVFMHIQSTNNCSMTNMHTHYARQWLTSAFLLFFFYVVRDANSKQLKFSVLNYSNMVHMLYFLIRFYRKFYKILLGKSWSIS